MKMATHPVSVSDMLFCFGSNIWCKVQKPH